MNTNQFVQNVAWACLEVESFLLQTLPTSLDGGVVLTLQLQTPHESPSHAVLLYSPTTKTGLNYCSFLKHFESHICDVFIQCPFTLQHQSNSGQ